MPNKATAKREAEIAASGLTPLEYMLKILRDEKADPKDRQWAAQAAAPYVHPRLSSVEHGGELTLKHEDALDQLDLDQSDLPGAEKEQTITKH